MKISILIPVYNEAKTIEKLLSLVQAVSLAPNSKEIIVVNDGSTDRTKQILTEFLQKNKNTSMKIFHHQKNQGKGAALQTALSHATGEYILIQDADLEYNPSDIPRLLQALSNKKTEVVYGTRLKRLPHFTREEKRIQFFIHYIGNKLLSLLVSILYGEWITDMETGYKLFPKRAVAHMVLHAKGFEFEPEITAKLLKKGYAIYEVPITTIPRGYDQGKKLHTVRDGLKALRALVVYRFVD